jgi:hypothetical protein
MVAAAESASRHDLNALNYPILPKSRSASKREFPELPKRPRDSHVFARARNDLYVERPWCSERLFAVETFPETGWDCCCGTATIPKAAWAPGLSIRASKNRAWRQSAICPVGAKSRRQSFVSHAVSPPVDAELRLAGGAWTSKS